MKPVRRKVAAFHSDVHLSAQGTELTPCEPADRRMKLHLYRIHVQFIFAFDSMAEDIRKKKWQRPLEVIKHLLQKPMTAALCTHTPGQSMKHCGQLGPLPNLGSMLSGG
ncbi:Rho-Related Gtp-Binding Protein Rhoe [Manis pentadactyla]|nr:Rho-Related Gtp-Binding Protein Rhoe [Manis pentadactyla]